MLLNYWAQLLKGKTVIAFALIDFRVSSDLFFLQCDYILLEVTLVQLQNCPIVLDYALSFSLWVWETTKGKHSKVGWMVLPDREAKLKSEAQTNFKHSTSSASHLNWKHFCYISLYGDSKWF